MLSEANKVDKDNPIFVSFLLYFVPPPPRLIWTPIYQFFKIFEAPPPVYFDPHPVYYEPESITLKVFWAFNSRCQVNDSTCQKGTNLSSDVTQISQHHETSPARRLFRNRALAGNFIYSKQFLNIFR